MSLRQHLAGASLLVRPRGLARRIPLACLWIAVLLGAASACTPTASDTHRPATTGTSPASTPPARIVSLVPSVTEILFAIGAGTRVVGVSSYDQFPPEVAQLPRVGALLDPNTERILSLRPDLVVLYGSQTEELARFAAAGIRTFSHRHGGVEGVLQTLVEVGDITGHASEAAQTVRDIRMQIAQVRRRVTGRPRPRTLLVIDRQPGTLQGIYVSGGRGFLHDMLEIAGGLNVFADIAKESVQPSHEGLLTVAPDVVIELSAAPREPRQIVHDRQLWQVLGTIPAVRHQRLIYLAGQHLVVPGPRLTLGIDALARALHPDVLAAP
jgi:iron complex transport system substrate-binding protein